MKSSECPVPVPQVLYIKTSQTEGVCGYVAPALCIEVEKGNLCKLYNDNHPCFPCNLYIPTV